MGSQMMEPQEWGSGEGHPPPQTDQQLSKQETIKIRGTNPPTQHNSTTRRGNTKGQNAKPMKQLRLQVILDTSQRNN
jgi:hypothetical protein